MINIQGDVKQKAYGNSDLGHHFNESLQTAAYDLNSTSGHTQNDHTSSNQLLTHQTFSNYCKVSALPKHNTL